ncbi:polysaccharide deacetylase family protein [Roseateles sp.]|uniref:polysaccharide deacetylase family protein n=1 Tax=Roseateles sp. TaxID=1971397 RepID=UPI002E18251C
MCAAALLAPLAARAMPSAVPILAYHRFAPTAVDSMTVRLELLDAQLSVLERLACRIVPLADWVAWRQGRLATLPERAVVLTADDGHRSQFEQLAPRLRERGWPVSLFVYPSAISNAGYAMTWAQLTELAGQEGVAVQSHTLWHPNLLRERRSQTPEAFQRFALTQLRQSREVLQRRLARPVEHLAWPFGLSDTGLQALAAEVGYTAAVSLGNRSATAADSLFDLPRHLIVDSISARQLESRLLAAFGTGAAS